MAKQSTSMPVPVQPERRFAEEMGILGERLGMPPMVARVLGWLLICDPPTQSLGELSASLGVSRASISIATRLLIGPGLIRRTAVPGARGYYFEVEPGAFTRLSGRDQFALLRGQLERGLASLPDPDGPRAARLREARDFYAFVEREIPVLIDRFRVERGEPRTEASA
jgi:DNA-binding MarR family transcriptional regulator